MSISSPLSRRALFARLGLLFPAGLSACATGGSSAEAGGARRGNRNLIIRAEIEDLPPGDLYVIVQRLRPRWLGRRGIGSPAVHVDGRYAGNIGVLRTLDGSHVQEIRFRSAADATTLYGTNYPAGVIEVSMRR